MKTENKLFLIIVLFLFSFGEINSLKCGADKFKLNPYHIGPSGDDERRRLDAIYSPIKIGVDYSSFTLSSLTDSMLNDIKSIIEDTLTEFSKFLQVQHTDIDLTDQQESIKKSCELETIGTGYENYLINNDVIIFPMFSDNLGDNVHATAAYCLTNGKRPRPVGGVLKISSGLSFYKSNLRLYLKRLIFHEVTHILVFNPTLLNRLGMTNTRNSVTYVKSSKVLSKAKEHFNCGSLTGIPLEDQGGNGTAAYHWEARYMLGDYMISTDYIDNVISDITLALFEDTKFYKVNYYSGGLFKYGKNKGCSFLNKKCVINGTSSYGEFCTSSGQGMCSVTRTGKGTCMIIDYSYYETVIPSKYQYFNNPNQGGFLPANFCPVVEGPNSDTDYLPTSCRAGTSSFAPEFGEIIGNNSFCFISSLLPSSSTYDIDSRPTCYRAECNKDTNQIVVYVGNSTFICPSEGGIVSATGFKGILTCPNYTEICSTESKTLCNDMFDCLNRKVESDIDTFVYDENEFNRFISGKNVEINFYFLAILILYFLI